MNRTAGAYHEQTSYERSKMGGHFLDWQNQPEVFKTYEGLKTVSMLREMPLPREDFFALYDAPPQTLKSHGVFDLETLSGILLLTNTLTSQARHPGGMFHYRSAASAGALYPTEIYVLSNGLTDLEDGLYHFSIPEHSLVKLRASDPLMKDLGSDDTPLTFFLTAIFFRSAWKYRNRSYRYHLLDTGHVLENLALSLKALGLPCDITFDFDDLALNHLLGLDEDREVALALCRLKGKPDSRKAFHTGVIEALPEKVKKASRVSPREFDVPEVLTVHRAGYEVPSGKPVLNMCNAFGILPEYRVPFPVTSPPDMVLPYPDAVFRRRSSRNFVAETLPLSNLSALLKVITTMGGDDMDRYGTTICTGFLAGGVEFLSDGFYVMDDHREGLGLVKPGVFMNAMSHICLDQEWMASASLHVLFMTDMKSLEQSWGARGYRYAMMTAGMMGERLYLAASVLGLGCCGIGAFYDGEASLLLGLNESSRVLYVVSLGILKTLVKRDAVP